MTDMALVTTTVATVDDARAISHALIGGKLAACVQQITIQSVFSWKGVIEEAAEIMLICKIRRDDYAEVEATILQLHPYETPELVMTSIIAGFQPYLDWIGGSTAR